MSRRHSVFITLILFSLLWVPLQAQQPTGEVHLQVKDPSGAVLEADGILSGPVKRSFQTNAQGFASLSGLPFGSYRIQIARTGFKTQFVMVEVRSSATIFREISLPVEGISTSVTVTSATPIGEADVPLRQIPVPIQAATAQDILNSNAIDLADVMNKRMNGVYVNENADNPFEPDINYRGYTASPLLGTPQGLSVYLDGVRQNQPFGDIVAWDLIPKIAISAAELIPGANPLYGLNTLGGAIAVRTKDGISNSGLSVETVGGAFGRASVEGEYGGSNKKSLDWYVAGNYYREDGWRQFSPSQVRQSFAKLRWSREKTEVALSGAYAINSLTGNGLQDFRFLNKNYSSVYSIPDTTWDHSPSLTLNATHHLTKHLTFSGNAYFRHVRTDTTNGDINDDSFDQSLYNLSAADIAALTAAGYTGFPTTGNPATEPFPFWRCIAQALEQDEPSEKCTGIITDTRTQQNNYGLSGLLSWNTKQNRFSVGAAWDRSSLSYGQLSQFGYLNTDGITITPVNAYADGSTSADGEPVDSRVNLHGSVNTPSFYLTDMVTLGRWNISASGRYNRTAVDNHDRLPPSSARGSLTGSYVFQRFNPAAGVVYHAPLPFSLYADYSEASRAPTSIELGCANPDFPCNLPNALVDDPPLQQVVSRTVEAGIRGNDAGILRWSAGWFWGQNFNDLLFVSSQQLGFGYFLNFGKTRRDGVEASLSARMRHLEAGGGYTFLNATYQSPQTLDGGSNSSNASSQAGLPGLDDEIAISPGDRIPQVPQHLLKLHADYMPLAKLTVSLNVVAISSSYARGNENNQDKPDGTYYLGSGRSPGYGIVNLGARYQLRPRFQLFIQANNLFDHHYYTAAQLGTTPYDNDGHFVARPFPPVAGDDGEENYPLRSTTFLAPGAPINVFGGLRVRLK